MWTEVIAELNEEQIRPISPDREALEAISTAIHIRTEQIVEVQKELVEAMNQQDLIDEQEYFAEVSCCLIMSSWNFSNIIWHLNAVSYNYC